jgi:hypothetical protein
MVPIPSTQYTDPTISVQRQKISLGSAEPSSAWAVSYRFGSMDASVHTNQWQN